MKKSRLLGKTAVGEGIRTGALSLVRPKAKSNAKAQTKAKPKTKAKTIAKPKAKAKGKAKPVKKNT